MMGGNYGMNIHQRSDDREATSAKYKLQHLCRIEECSNRADTIEVRYATIDTRNILNLHGTLHDS